MKPDTMPEILNVSDVARYLRVHQTTIYRLIKHGDLPSFRVGSDHRFTLADIEAWQRAGGTKQ